MKGLLFALIEGREVRSVIARNDNKMLVLQRWEYTKGDNGKPHKVDEFTLTPVSSSEFPLRSLCSRAQES